MNDLLSGFDSTRPLETARTIPNAWYTDSRMVPLERERVFAKSWQAVGRTEQVRDRGAFLTADVAGEPILVVRDSDGILRGFYNVCRHRAAPIETAPCGIVDKLRCRYHGWTYDLAGRLRGTPEFEGVQDFAKEDHGLVPLGGVTEWGPFVWVHLERPTQSIEQFLDPLPAFVEARKPFEKLKFAERRTYDIACNWKVYVDNYLDGGYHVNSVHPALAGVLDYRDYRTTVHGFTSLQSSPLKPGDGTAGLTRTGDVASYWWAWPNFMINVYDGVMDTNLVLPLGPDRCRVVFDFYFVEGIAESFIRDSIAVAEQVQLEDVGVCEEVQRGLNSRSYSVGRFSVKREIAGYHFHKLLGEELQNG